MVCVYLCEKERERERERMTERRVVFVCTLCVRGREIGGVGEVVECGYVVGRGGGVWRCPYHGLSASQTVDPAIT